MYTNTQPKASPMGNLNMEEMFIAHVYCVNFDQWHGFGVDRPVRWQTEKCFHTWSTCGTFWTDQNQGDFLCSFRLMQSFCIRNPHLALFGQHDQNNEWSFFYTPWMIEAKMETVFRRK